MVWFVRASLKLVPSLLVGALLVVGSAAFIIDAFQRLPGGDEDGALYALAIWQVSIVIYALVGGVIAFSRRGAQGTPVRPDLEERTDPGRR
jgi:hypothetical protein